MSRLRSITPLPGAKGENEGDWNEELSFIKDKLSNVLETLIKFKEQNSEYDILPKEEQVFEGFRLVPPLRVKVVFVEQSPYPGVCYQSGLPYACGPAFLPSEGCVTEPLTLKVMMKELCRDLGLERLPASPRALLLSWMEQGVMLLNASLTLGTGCPKNLQDHGILWEEFMRGALSHMAKCCNNPVFVLIGRDAWKFEECVKSCITIKVSHPVARGKSSLPWIGSRVFSRVSEALGERIIVWTINEV